MKQGDFTQLAQNYHYRTGYSLRLLKHLAAYMGAWRETFVVLDIGAGTGKLSENLRELGLKVLAIEPNDAMRAEGEKFFATDRGIEWRKGSAEQTGLDNGSVDWILMGSAFHWTDAPVALAEFARVLKPNGFFTALWNPRDLEQHALHQRIEQIIYDICPQIQRVSSGSGKYTQDLEQKLLSTGDFDHLIFMEAPHTVKMSQTRYLGAWRSVNDIQAQAGPQKFEQMLQEITAVIKDLEYIEVPYKTRAWTVQKQSNQP